MAEEKLAGIKGALHCGHLQQRFTQLKSKYWHVPTPLTIPSYLSGKGWNLLFILIEHMNTFVLQMTKFDILCLWEISPDWDLLVEN